MEETAFQCTGLGAECKPVSLFNLRQPANSRLCHHVFAGYIDSGVAKGVHIQTRLPEDVAADGNREDMRAAAKEEAVAGSPSDNACRRRNICRIDGLYERITE